MVNINPCNLWRKKRILHELLIYTRMNCSAFCKFYTKRGVIITVGNKYLEFPLF